MSVFNELSGAETENSLKLTFKTGIKILALEKLLQHDRRSVTWHILYPCFHSPLMAGVNADGMTAKHDDDDDSNLSSQVLSCCQISAGTDRGQKISSRTSSYQCK